jgi:lysophospholipase L1-like esterase
MSTRKKLLFATIVTLSFFLAAELLLRGLGFAARAAAPGMQFHVPEIQSAGYDVDPDIFWQLKADFQGVVSDNHPWEIRTNSARMRGPEFDAEKVPGTLRIVSMGDSSAFGWGVPEERTYARLLEGYLNERQAGGGRRFEVLNAGVPGYTSFQGLGYLRRDLLDLEPDVVLTYFGLNDLTGARFYSDREQGLQTESAAAYLLKRSRIYQVMWKLLRGSSTEERFDNYFTATDHFRVPPEEYRKNLREMQRLVEERSGRTFFIRPTWSSPDASQLHAHAYWFPEAIDLLDGVSPVVDAYAALKDSKAEVSALFMDIAHPTERGHALIAEAIYLSLVNHGIAGG